MTPTVHTQYAIAATVLRSDGLIRSLPTFYLDSRTQGILSTEHAQRVALDIIDPFGLYPDLEIGAVAV